jgi:hypothetical protein
MSANSVNYVRELVNVKPTPHDMGLEMTIKVIAYDNVLMLVNGNPIGKGRNSPWGSTHRCVAQMLEEFEDLAMKRQAETTPDHDEPAVIITVPSLDDVSAFLDGVYK